MTDAIVTHSEHFSALARNELQRTHRKLQVVRDLSPQHLYIRSAGSFGKLTRPWKQKLPIYLHHIFPVHEQIKLKNKARDLAHLQRCAYQLCNDDFTVQVRIVGEYRYVPLSVAHAIRPTHDFSPLPPRGRVLSILIVDNVAYMGVSWSAQNLSPYTGGLPQFGEPVPNRAGRKLLEALDTFRICLHPMSLALDLGAAPGAWTELLRRRDVHVTAVAPTDMYDWLAVDPHVETHQMTAEDYLEACTTQYDVLLNDMKMDAQDSAKLMVAYARHLKQGGIAIMTLKLRMRNTRRVMDHSFRILRQAYKILNVRQLVSNRKEVTLFLRKHD